MRSQQRRQRVQILLATTILATTAQLTSIRADAQEISTTAQESNAQAITLDPIDVKGRSDGTVGYATDGTPVDCVRLASLGLIESFQAELVVAGINHGANLGDDITYSGTVAAALEGVVLGLPSIAVSQQSRARSLDYRFDGGFGFEVAAEFVARLVARIEDVPLPATTLLNVNVPAGEPSGVEVTSLGKRIYRDELKLEREEEHRRRYWIYGSDPGFHDEPGTDLAAVAAGRIAVTPIHFDLTDRSGLEALRGFDLNELLAPSIGDRPAPEVR